MTSPVAATPEAVVVEAPTDDDRSGRGSLLNRHPLLAYALRRFGLYLLELWGAITIAFFFFRLMPGDPVRTLLQQIQQQYGSTVQSNAEITENYKREFGLDGSLLEQYVRYLNRLILHQDMGVSLLAYPAHAQTLIMRALPWTIGLMFVSAVLSWVIGVAVGAVVGWRRGKKDAEFLTNTAIGLSQVPFYFVGLILVYVLSYMLGWLPSRGAYDSQIAQAWSADFIGSVLYHAILPSLSMVVIGWLGWLLSTRMLMLPLLGEDFLTYAEAKGLKPREILVKYALRNCYLPQITAFGISLGFIFNGNVLVEQLFGYPGLGSTLVTAIGQLDFNTILGITTIAIFAVLTANLLLDLILPLLDPRVKFWK